MRDLLTFHPSASVVFATLLALGGCTVTTADAPSVPTIDGAVDDVATGSDSERPASDAGTDATASDTSVDAAPSLEDSSLVDSSPTKDSAAPPDSSPPVDAAGLKVVTLGPTATAAQILAAITNDSNDVVELSAGTYSPGLIKVDVDRTRPVVVRPAAGASGKVIWKQATTGAGAFWFGVTGKTGNITMDDLIFDGYALGHTGVFWVGYAHDLTLTHITVRNATGDPGYSWALYVSTDFSHRGTNIVANDWVVQGAGTRSLSAMTSYHDPDNAIGVTMHRWNVKNVAFAIYAVSDATGLDVADWTIDDAGHTTSSGIAAIYFEKVKGAFKNMHLTSSGALVNFGGTMIDGGGSTF